MAYSIKDPETDEIIRKLAKVKGKPIVEAIKEACANELERERAKIPLWERLQPLRARVASYPAKPEQPFANDKEFFDALWNDEK
ncbi:type II toxin-antitoxin system VapB family antitoxin [Methylocystis heyeri]|uniref:Transcription factor n=1 Tax=Methylocystis heyeri TaxID=391905 RepID=A0A6B8KGX7_9HYPH|nr:type II toxin-antitoxin system VapB family antitoxin [Methylocystis heyeri]QGM46977.1 transcription factor [Methylocystis heyeri]